MAGYGDSAWGSSPWGTGGEELRLLSANPIRENVLRLEFNVAPRLSFLADPRDGSLPDRYSVVPVDGTEGRDGLPPRPVSPFEIGRAAVPLSLGRFVDVTVDRRLSPYPARYLVSVNRLVAFDGMPLDPARTSVEADGLRRGLPVNLVSRSIGRTDLAGTIERPGEPPFVPADASGDVATDRGLASYRKRVLRRLLTRRGAFAHLPGYGVGTAAQIKRLATASVRAKIVADAEEQIRREPETESVRATLTPIADEPGAWLLQCEIRAKAGSLVVETTLSE